MNCPECGGPIVLGSDRHTRCRVKRELRESREERIGVIVDWFGKESERRGVSVPELLDLLIEKAADDTNTTEGGER